jgi:TetR/AcrR family transcriptional regulator, tetracycline repressor protein
VRLNRADVLDGAMALLEAEGLEGLTMRRLAASLHVQPGALYWHFTDKKALLDAMADRMLAGVDDGVDGALPWDLRATELAVRLRAALRAHRDGARIQAGTFGALPNTLRVGDALLRTFLDAGLSEQTAGTAIFSLLYYILGHTIEEQARDELVAADKWPPAADAIDANEYPQLAHVKQTLDAANDDERFRDGLEIFLDGIRDRSTAVSGATSPAETSLTAKQTEAKPAEH